MSFDKLPEELRHHFDHTSAMYSESDIDESNRLLRQCPVVHSDQHEGFWVVSRYADVVDTMKNHKVFSSAAGMMIPPGAHLVPVIPTESDDPLHVQYRQILWPFLTPGAVLKYQPFIRASARALIDGVIDRGRMNVLDEFARPLPAGVTGQFFGMSAGDGELCVRWVDTMISESTRNREAAAAAAAEYFACMQRLLDEANELPGASLIHAIVSGTVDGRPLSNNEALGLLATSIGGALETTISALALGVNLLGRYPEQRARLVANPSLIPRAVEEILRIDPPALTARTAVAEGVVGETSIRPGERVLLLFRSANHDETVFADPEEFRVERTNNNHLAFGYGIHKCAGQHLARLELRVAFEELLRQIPDFVVEGNPRPYVKGPATWGLSELTISWG